MSGLDDAAEGGSQRKNDSKAMKKTANQKKIEDDGLELCLWASYRGQTLARTVRGMMYYERSGLVPVPKFRFFCHLLNRECVLSALYGFGKESVITTGVVVRVLHDVLGSFLL